MTLEKWNRSLKLMLETDEKAAQEFRADMAIKWTEQARLNMEQSQQMNNLLKVEDYIGTEGAPYENYDHFVKTMIKFVNPKLNKPDECQRSVVNSRLVEELAKRVFELEEKDKAKDE